MQVLMCVSVLMYLCKYLCEYVLIISHQSQNPQIAQQLNTFLNSIGKIQSSCKVCAGRELESHYVSTYLTCCYTADKM